MQTFNSGTPQPLWEVSESLLLPGELESFS